MVEINNLVVDYGNFRALEISKSLRINEGDRIGIIGSNGAGKTTFINSILGLAPYKGSIKSNIKAEGIAVHMQFNEYNNNMSIKSIMEFILNTKVKSNDKLQSLIEYFEMEKHLNKKYKDLSGGQKQRFTLIMVIYQDSPLTFFDEVTSGLDFESREKLMLKINEWYSNKSSAVCLVTHYYDELDLLADKILLFDKGKVVDFDYKKKLFEKYCGYSLLIMDNNNKNEELTAKFNRILSPNHLIALKCNDSKDEIEIAKILIENNIDFKRSTTDLEIMSINAKEKFLKGGN